MDFKDKVNNWESNKITITLVDGYCTNQQKSQGLGSFLNNNHEIVSSTSKIIHNLTSSISSNNLSLNIPTISSTGTYTARYFNIAPALGSQHNVYFSVQFEVLSCPPGYSHVRTGTNNNMYYQNYSCYQCNAGYYSIAGQYSCTQCPSGTYSTAGSSSCTQCQKGTYQDERGQNTCKDAGVDKYVDTEGATKPIDCGPGKTTNGNTRATDISQCVFSSCPAGWAPNANNICEKCKQGTYSYDGKSCKVCPDGTTSLEGALIL